MSFSRNEIDTMSGTRKRTYQLLVTTALQLFEQGMLPTQSWQHMLVFQGQRRIAIFPLKVI